MRRGVHTAISLLAILLVIKPFDCFSTTKFTKESADCCKRGKCSPSTGDDCCKGTIPDGYKLAASKAYQHQAPVVLPVIGIALIVEPVFMRAILYETDSPTVSPPGSRFNLPLLI